MTFFFGLLLYDRCNTIKHAIDEYLNQKKYIDALEMHQDAPFAYVWFLICLFHDLGYTIENKADLEYSDYDKLEQSKSWREDVDGVPQIFKEVLPNYFKYRNSCTKEKDGVKAANDHGICAAHYMYAELCSIQEKKKKLQNEDSKWWKDELKVIFNLTAWVVASHNIWAITESAKEDKIIRYKEAGLEKLILKRNQEGNLDYLIKLEEHPFLFLFCLVDTIEPVKVVEDIRLLDKIDMEIAEEGLKIDIKLICQCRNRLLSNIEGLKDWLTNVSVSGNTGRICLHY